MTKRTIFKTIELFTLLMLAIGILSLSVKTNQVQAHDLTNNNQMMGHMIDANSSYGNNDNLTSEEKQELVSLMQKHHGDNWQDYHQQMHGSDNGIQKKGGGL